MKGEGQVSITHFLDIENFHKDGILYSKFMLEPGNSIGYHVHKGRQESFYILKGQGLYNDNGEEMIIKQGDVALCKDGEGHSIKNDGQENLEFIALIINV